MLLKDGIVALRQKGASLGLIRELLATVDVAVSTATIARFHAEMTDSSTSSRQRQRFNRRGDHVQKASRRKRDKWFVPRTKLLRLLNKVSRSFILQDEILDGRWIRGLVLTQIRAQSMISQQEPQVDWRQTRQTYTRRSVRKKMRSFDKNG